MVTFIIRMGPNIMSFHNGDLCIYFIIHEYIITLPNSMTKQDGKRRFYAESQLKNHLNSEH